MPNNDPQWQCLEKRRIRQSFDAAAGRYDEVAVLQREVGKRIIERLDLIRLVPERILDVGAGTGVCSQALSKHYPQARIISLDLAPRMLEHARRRGGWLERLRTRQTFVCGDAEQLPIADHSVDLVFSNLTLQWCSDLEQTFREFRRVLKPGGLLMFSTFGPDTLKELRTSWRIADTSRAVHVHDFIDMHDVGDALLRAELAEPVMDMESFTLTYPDVYQLMRELKTLGAHNAAHARHHSLTGKRRVQNMAAAYEDLRRDGNLPATYEVVYGHAWGPAAARGDISIPLDRLQPGRQRP
jgi:malonyl-CoA O-methyltransferase